MSIELELPSAQWFADIVAAVHARELEMRKGIETIESAFGGFVDWLSTPKLPEKMAQAFEARGYHPELPPPPVKTQMVLEGS